MSNMLAALVYFGTKQPALCLAAALFVCALAAYAYAGLLTPRPARRQHMPYALPPAQPATLGRHRRAA